jgi:hypothetical protein
MKHLKRRTFYKKKKKYEKGACQQFKSFSKNDFFLSPFVQNEYKAWAHTPTPIQQDESRWKPRHRDHR